MIKNCKTYKFYLVIVSFTLFFSFVGNEKIQAQCKTCTVSVGETCTTGTAEEGWLKCSCSSGCKCEKTCDIGMLTKIYLDKNFNWEELEVPFSGLDIELNKGANSNFLYSYFTEPGYLGGEQIANVLIGEKLAIYMIKVENYIIYPVDNKGNVKLYSQCNGEILATVSSLSK